MSSLPQTTTALSDTDAPLLRPLQGGGATADSSPPASLAMLLGRASGRRGPSLLVRERAARELQERRADWGYSKPVVALDVMWNTAFVIATIVMLICSVNERPNTPLRVWICGYAVQCLVHVVLVLGEYQRRNMRMGNEERLSRTEAFEGSDSEVEEDGQAGLSISKRCESLNTMIAFIWWIIGFYWVVSGGDILLQNAPHLYWLAVVFLAFDVFFAIFCVVLACLIGIALCCCLPFIVAILYAVAGQEGASEADLSILAKYRYEISSSDAKYCAGAGKMVPVATTSRYLANERLLLREDAELGHQCQAYQNTRSSGIFLLSSKECCICLSSYEDGAELQALPCSHHFHSTCIVKWLKMNATCPLCKYNILKGNEEV